MNFLNFFKSANTATTAKSTEETKASDPVTIQDPVQQSSTTSTRIHRVIDVFTNKPIDAAYVYIKKDYEDDGYNDAITLMDVAYMDKGVAKIVNGLRILFRQIRRKYEDALLELQKQKAVFESMFMTSSLSETNSKISLINSHLEELTTLESDLDNNAPDMQNMVDTYKRGFMTGIMAKNGVVTRPVTSPLSTSNIGVGLDATVTTTTIG